MIIGATYQLFLILILHDCLVTVSINYKTQVIDKLVEDISIRIDKQILNSYLK